jgi:HSP20 family protein
MAINVWRPYQDMLSLREAMDRLFESSVVRAPSDERTETPGKARLAVDMYETEDDLVIRSRVPGINPDNLEITATEDAIVIQGGFEAEEANEGENRRWHAHELWTGEFQRTIPLHTRVELSNIEAKFEQGVLTLTLPKAEEVKPKKLTIKVN